MEFSQDIALRPRFSFPLNIDNEHALDAFVATKEQQTDFLVSRVDDHVFIRIPKDKQHFWSPQLHLEIATVADRASILKGLFGPKPAVWTLFMFFHFLVAVLFIGFGVWTYTNMRLENNYTLQIVLMVLMVILWFVLYFAGRMGRAKGRPEMQAMNEFMRETLTKIIV